MTEKELEKYNERCNAAQDFATKYGNTQYLCQYLSTGDYVILSPEMCKLYPLFDREIVKEFYPNGILPKSLEEIPNKNNPHNTS